MSFTFLTGVPAANNDPSVDQPDMQTNNVSTNGIISVDHVTFNASNGGQHKQVTFNDNNIPALPTAVHSANNIGVLFTNVVGAGTVNQLFYYAGSAAQSSDQYVSATPGSVMLLGGIILKWGSITGTNLGATITFVSPFPNACFCVTVTSQEPAISSSPAVTTVTTSGFKAFRSSVGNQSLYYIAIGN